MFEYNKIYNMDCLEGMKQMPDNSVDVLFTDPPYALGSEIEVKENGKVDYKKATDFMNKWEMPTAEFWEEYFKEAKRILKHGGHLLMFGMDRQLLLFKYYGALANLTEKQSLYWYYISNFPKSSNLEKNLDKKEPSLKDKYAGYRYSVAPLKQTNETILVFQKPYKKGSCLNDIIEYEKGDKFITCGAINIEDNRVPTKGELLLGGKPEGTDGVATNFKSVLMTKDNQPSGRYPSQTFCDNETAEVLDKQSGINKGNGHWSKTKVSGYGEFGGGKSEYYGIGNKDKEEAGCSKILYKCSYEQGDYDLYYYNTKVNAKERNEGLNNIESKTVEINAPHNSKSLEERYTMQSKNPHPTVKPIALIEKILKLFVTPTTEVVLDTFIGSGTLGIVCVKNNINFIGFEINKEYCEIAEAKLKYYENINKNKITQSDNNGKK